MMSWLKSARGLFSLLVSFGRRRPTVLMYHSIGSNRAHFNVTPAMFARQMEHLAKKGYEVVSLEACVRRARAGQSGKFVALTFDDGYRDFLTTALPVLRQHQFPATVFIITARMGELRRTSDGAEIPMMTWEEAVQARGQGAIIGSHALTHSKLTELDDPAVREELEESRAEISKRLGHMDPMWFCYPYGRHSGQTMRLARDAGYAGAVTVESGHPGRETDLLAVPRKYVHSRMGMMEFSALFV